MIPADLRNDLVEHCGHYPSARVGLIYVLQKLQEHYGGWLPDESLAEAESITGVPEAEVEGLATFYNWLFREPVGRKVIVVCDSISCHLCGCDKIRRQIEQRLGIRIGETTLNGDYTLLPICCLGDCSNAPAIMIGAEHHNRLTPEKIDELLPQLGPGGAS